MNTTTRKRGMVAGIVGVTALVIIAIVASLTMNATSSSKKTTDTAASVKSAPCADVKTAPRLMAYDTATKTDNFGPAVTQREVSAVLDEFHKRMCTDWALASAETMYLTTTSVSSDEYVAKANEFQANHQTWGAAVKKVDTMIADAKSVTVEQSSLAYHTLWFERGDSTSALPSLAQGTIPAKFSIVLKIVAKDGKVYMLRLECGFQPFAPPSHFPNVPPPSGCHTTGTCSPSNCHTTHTCTPPGCQPTPGHPCTPHKCVCVSPTKAAQPVPTPPPGPVGAPTKAPSQNPTVPANTGNPAPPTPGGYNGGSTQQPGQSGTPTPVVPSSDPTNTGDPGGF